MSFSSILFEGPDKGSREILVDSPAFFRDLNLDQIVDAITVGREEYDLKPFFYTRLNDVAAISYRHDIMLDVENEVLFQCLKSFSTEMRTIREHQATTEKLYYRYQRERWFIDAVEVFGVTVKNLVQNLRQIDLQARGLRSFQAYLAEYVESTQFKVLFEEAQRLKSELSDIRYSLVIHDSSITVRNYDAEADYSAIIEEIFAKFKQGAVSDYRVNLSATLDMSDVEARVLDMVAELHPEVFLALDDYCTSNKNYLDKTIVDFDREIQFYLAYLEYTERFKRVGLKFCYPRVSDTSKHVVSRDGFDLALAGKLMGEDSAVVCNDFMLSGDERILVVTGPNQGGKTTYARTFGQLHYLAGLGLPVPGSTAQLLFYDHLFTHFEQAENFATLRGKLLDDLVRLHATLARATPNSIVIMNEVFSSTTVQDALYLSRKILDSLSDLDLLCVCVTFLDELSILNEKTVSVVATMLPDNPTLRTYRIERRPADGLAYALTMADRYRLTYEHLKERLRKR